MAFDTAIYTDVSRDESLDGVDGFNFQAASAGVTGKEFQAIREVMLHRISSQWPVEREERDHPPSCAFAIVADDYYFSRGISTGTTNNGRRGNQLTQAIVTRDSENIEPYRPAQLYAARNWSLQKAQAKSVDAWFAPLEIDPAFESEALLEDVLADPWMLQTLPQFLSMIAESNSGAAKKTVLIHHDLDTVMRWIAVGSLLISQADALTLEFRAFVADPFRARGQIVGTHPDLLQGSLAGANVINLIEQTVTPVTVTPLSQKISEWIERLDAFDALEVIEIAQRWQPELGDELAAAAAEMVTGNRTGVPTREEWALGIRVIEELARAGRSADLELYSDELGDSVSMYQLHGEADFLQSARSASFTMAAGLSSLAEAIVLPTLTSLLDDRELEWAGSWAREMRQSEHWAWPSVDEPEQFAAPLTAILLRAPARALPELLKTVHPLSASLPHSELTPMRQRVVEFLMQHPEAAAADLSEWYGRASIERGLRRALVTAVEHANPTISHAYREQLVAGVWDFLVQPPAQELDQSSVAFESWIRAARLARVPVEERASAISAQGELPGQATWVLALSPAKIPTNMDVFVAWVTRVGADTTLSNLLLTELKSLMSQDPKKLKPRQAHVWIPLVEAFAARSPENQLYGRILDALIEFHAAIPTFGGKVMEKADGLFTPWKNRKGD